MLIIFAPLYVRGLSQVDEDVAARCETVLNTTMAEMETYHSQKIEDFAAITKEHLDGEIDFYEQVGKLHEEICCHIDCILGC